MSLDDEQRDIYAWQIDVPDFGEAGQERLASTSILVSRVGGLGSVVALELAAAGVGKLVLAHGGNTKPSDLNRQLLQTYDHLGKPRIESIAARLHDLNPRLEIVAEPANASTENVDRLVEQTDLVVDCAPLFEERFALNDACVRQNKVLVEAAMFELQAQLTTIRPGVTPCLRCLYPETPPAWKRRFPVFGAVSATVGSIAAMEAIKVAARFGEPLFGTMLRFDLRDVSFHRAAIQKRADCEVCGA